MKPRKPNETDADYIRRLEDQNQTIKQRNDDMAKWGRALNEAVTILSCDASLAFQAMAEKAGVRSHPSVTAVVELFDTISHPQWRGDKVIPKIEFPQFWDLDGPKAWTGDADMQLNSPIGAAIELLERMKFSAKRGGVEEIRAVVEGLHAAVRRGVEGIKDRSGFKPKHVSVPSAQRFDAMTVEELREYVSAIGWMALDLAQDMEYANEMLRRDLRAAVYRRVCADLYALSQFSIETPEGGNINIKVLGGEPAPF